MFHSIAEGGEGMSVGGHYWLLCLVEESVFAISEIARHVCVRLAIFQITITSRDRPPSASFHCYGAP